MSVDLTNSLSVKHVYGADQTISSSGAKNSDASMQKWKKEFEQALANNSACSSISSDDSFVPVVQNEFCKNDNKLPVNNNVFVSVSKNAKVEESSIVKGQPDSAKMLIGQGNTVVSTAKSIFSVVPTQTDKQFNAQEESDAVLYRSYSGRYARQAALLSDGTNHNFNVSVFIDHYKAKLWFANSQNASSRQLDSIISKVRQTLRDKNIALSSLVVNGKNIYSENKIKE